MKEDEDGKEHEASGKLIPLEGERGTQTKAEIDALQVLTCSGAIKTTKVCLEWPRHIEIDTTI